MKYKQIGSALITALFMVAIVAVIATAMAIQLEMNIHRTMLVQNAIKLYQVTQGVTYWAIGQLKQNVINNQKNPSIKLVDPLPLSFSDTPYQGMIILGALKDAQAYFNINNLITLNYLASFTKLLHTLNPNLTSKQLEKIILAIRERLLRNNNHHFISITQLRTIPSMSASLYQKLSAYIIALPTITKININTAGPIILMALSPKMTYQQANEIIRYRKNNQGFKTRQQYILQLNKYNLNLASSMSTLTSHYFISIGRAHIGKQSLEVQTLLYRQIHDKHTSIKVIRASHKGG